MADIPAEAMAAAMRSVAITLPGMEQVEVTRNLRYSTAPDEVLRMDVYRPPGLGAGERRPAVILIHGGGPAGAPFKEMGLFQSMGRLVAAQGLVGVAFTHRSTWQDTDVALAGEDVAAALAYMRAHADGLNIDTGGLAVAAWSGGGAMLAPFLRDADAQVRCLVGVYPILDLAGSSVHRAAEDAATLAAWSPLDQLARPGRKPPLFLVRAGADAIPDLLPGLDRFVAEALARDYPLTLANNPGAPHGFDVAEPTPRTVEILEDMLAFVRRHLGM